MNQKTITVGILDCLRAKKIAAYDGASPRKQGKAFF